MASHKYQQANPGGVDLTWRILQIGVYSFEAGQLRAIDFPVERSFHLISGRMQRGKSALQDIVHYCLLKGESTIPPGVITDKVDAVGVAVQSKGRTALIVRPLPESTTLPVSKVWLEFADDGRLPIEMPTRFELTVPQALAELSKFTGIESESLQGRAAGSGNRNVSVKHALPYCLQPQEVIANPRALLPDLEYYYKAQDTLEAAEYFFGVLDLAGNSKARELAEVESRLRIAERRVADLTATGVRGQDAGLELFGQAQELGLLTTSKVPENAFDLIAALKTANESNYRSLTQDGNASLAQHASELAAIRRQISILTDKAGRLAGYNADIGEYVKAQQNRTENLQIVTARELGQAGNVCPLCGEETRSIKRIEEQLASAVSSLETKLRLPETARRRLAKEQERDTKTMSELRAREAVAEARLKDAQRNLGMTEQLERKRKELMWRVGFYLEHFTIDADDPREEVSRLQRQVVRLRRELDLARARLGEFEAKISSQITEYARRLDAEFKEGCVFSIKNLELQVVHRGNRQPLHTIGSGANQVIYHVATVLAIHEHFLVHGLPVPNFLMLDQPSQAWFPTSKEMEARDAPVTGKSTDVGAVDRLYKLLWEEAKRLHLQIVVVDHARPEIPEILESVCEDWRDDSIRPQRPDRLVPETWKSRPVAFAG